MPLGSTRGELTVEFVGAALSAIPIAGGPLAAAANAFLSRRQNRRFSEFLLKLSEDMRAVEDRVNKEVFASDDFPDIVEELFSKATEAKRQERLDALRAVFINLVLSDVVSYDDAEELIALVSELQERHIIMLRILADPVRADRELGNVVGSGGGMSTSFSQIFGKLLPRWTDEQIERTWADLYERKLHKSGGTKAMMTDKGIHQLEGRLTPFGKRVVRVIINPVDR